MRLSEWKIPTVILLLCLFLSLAECYHTEAITSLPWDCWPLNATETNPDIVDCKGLELYWGEEPPDEIEEGQPFNVSYYPMARTEFYDTENGLSDFCNQNDTCPFDGIGSADETNCCVWHANIHTCHPSLVSGPCRKICGPWIVNGALATHTLTSIGSMNTTFRAMVIINHLGTNIIIAHLRVRRMQIVIGKEIVVVPKKVCGDDKCSAEIGEDCDTCQRDCCPIPPGAIAAIVICGVMIPAIIGIVVAGSWYFYRQHKLFFDESWIINYNDIQRDANYKGFMGSLVSMKNLKFLHPEAESGHDEEMVYNMRCRQVFTQTGIYEGRTVAIKGVPKQDFVLNNAIRKEVMQIRVLDHPNLCKFIGATVKDGPSNFTIISEYCPKGSLNDVLQNDDIPLNWGFRFSFATDAARGLAYMHSKRLFHGHLTSSNCTIDDRWVLKISDYGLPSFRSPEKASLSDSGGRSILGIYMPPEAKGLVGTLPASTTDVYSFAIILVEIATRMDPYSEDLVLNANGKPKITLSDLKENNCPCPEDYTALVYRCWAFIPAARPTADQIKKILYHINPSRESPVDMMMIMMEKYSKHLEVLVAERTQELIAEQKKTATLLYSMLPKTVADHLKQGKPASAQCFQSATIFFSDIVGFTSLASASTPMQIVNLLNELYSTFDDILDHFDVYKVETIGDAYMVVSGVPRENGDKHASEIACMALELIAACKKFRIPHRPDTKLEIRAGVHSGPVCAGVVGMKMPRYCLFGDTVNTASRMETTSEAMKIQASDTTYQLLQKLGEFRTECRGNVSIKGKGTMFTWWLLGRNDGLSSVSLRSRVTSPTYNHKKPRGTPPKITISEIVRDGPVPERAISGNKRLFQESSMNGSMVKMTLPGEVI